MSMTLVINIEILMFGFFAFYLNGIRMEYMHNDLFFTLGVFRGRASSSFFSFFTIGVNDTSDKLTTNCEP